jgi:hypothetical protein
MNMQQTMSQHEQGNCRKRWSEWSVKARVGMIAAAMIFVPVFLALFAAVTMRLWNWLMPEIFKLPVITFWQAVGLLFLSHILLRGGHVGRGGHSRWREARLRKQMGEQGPVAKTV